MSVSCSPYERVRDAPTGRLLGARIYTHALAPCNPGPNNRLGAGSRGAPHAHAGAARIDLLGPSVYQPSTRTGRTEMHQADSPNSRARIGRNPPTQRYSLGQNRAVFRTAIASCFAPPSAASGAPVSSARARLRTDVADRRLRGLAVDLPGPDGAQDARASRRAAVGGSAAALTGLPSATTINSDIS